MGIFDLSGVKLVESLFLDAYLDATMFDFQIVCS